MKSHQSVIACALVAFCFMQQAQSFAPTTTFSPLATTELKMAEDPPMLEAELTMPPSNLGLSAQIKLRPVLDTPSELFEVRYKIPFGLDVQPQNGMAVCTKDGAGGEKVGDVLRLSSQWTMGLPRGNGLMTTAASFSGAIGWQCSLFDVTKASQWEEVVEALVSNTPDRTDEVLLVFERATAQE